MNPRIPGRCTWSLLLAAGLAAAPLTTLRAAPVPHLAGEDSADQLARLILDKDGITLRWELDLAEFPAEDLRRELDRDRDGTITPAEERVWLGRGARELLARVQLKAAGTLLALRLRQEGTELELGRRQTGPIPLRIRFHLWAPLPEGRESPREITLSFQAFPGKPGFVRAYLEGPGEWQDLAYLVADSADPNRELARYEQLNQRINAATGSAVTLPRDEWPPQRRWVTWVAAGGTVQAAPASGPAAAQPPAAEAVEPTLNEAFRRFFDALHAGRFQWFFLVMAVLYGAGHALMPGHGKAITGAFLVGSRGTVADAVLLGLTVTATHTVAVYALGLAYLFVSPGLDRAGATRTLEVVSGLLVAGIGLILVETHGRRLLGEGPWGLALRRLVLAAGGLALAALLAWHDRPWLLAGCLAAGLAWIQGAALVRSRGQVAGPAPEPSHDHGHDHHHDQTSDHHHDHAPGHHHGPGVHRHEIPLDPATGRPRLWQVLSLGVTGGIVPCPTGLVIVSLSMAPGGRQGPWIGLLLVTLFSLGMAAVLVAIGVAAVKGLKVALVYGGPGAERAFRVVPFLSALFIAGLGLVLVWAALAGIPTS